MIIGNVKHRSRAHHLIFDIIGHKELQQACAGNEQAEHQNHFREMLVQNGYPLRLLMIASHFSEIALRMSCRDQHRQPP